jgi:putative ABC transport system permease protein
MKILDLIRTAASNTVRSKLRTTLTVLALFVGAFTLTLTTALGAGVSNYVTKQVASVGASDVFLISKSSASSTSSGPQKYDPATSSASSGTANPLTGSAGTLSAKDIETLKGIPGLTDVNPIAPVSIDWVAGPASGKYQLSIAPTSSIGKSDLKSGAQLNATSSEREIVLPNDYVKALQLGSATSAVGKQVTIGLTDVLGTPHELTATVVGVSNASLLSSGAGANSALVNKLSSEQNSGSKAPARYPNAIAHFDKNASTATIDSLKKKIAGQGMTAQTIADQLGVVQTIITGITGVLNAFAIVALLAAAFGIVNTLLMSVQERTREIGLMKAMGMSSSKVFALFSLEAAFIGFLGSAIGAGVAILAGLGINAALSGGVLAGLAGLHLLLFQPASIIAVILLIIVIAFLAGTLPARRAARKTPIDALRYE